MLSKHLRIFPKKFSLKPFCFELLLFIGIADQLGLDYFFYEHMMKNNI